MELTQEELITFVKLWQSDEGLPVIVTAMGLTIREATTTAHGLRKNGVELRDRRRRSALDYEALAQIAAQEASK